MIQPLEDGFFEGNPSDRIGRYTEFPDEIFADVGAFESELANTKYKVKIFVRC